MRGCSAPRCLSGVSFTDMKLTERSTPVLPSPSPSSYTHTQQSPPHNPAAASPRAPHRTRRGPGGAPERGRGRSGHTAAPERGCPGAAAAERGRGAGRALRAAGGAAGRARQPRLPSGLALMKTRTLLPLGTRWDGSAERLPEKAARRSAASRGQGSLPPVPAGHIPPAAPQGEPPPHSSPRSAAAAPAALATGWRAAAMRTLGLSGAAACLRGSGAARAGAVAAARLRSAEGARGRCADRPPLRSLAAAGGEESPGWKVCGGAVPGAAGAAEAGGSPAPPRRARPARRAAGGCAQGAPSGRRVAPVPPPPVRVCGVQSGDASGEADGAFAPPSVSQPRGRIFIGKLLPAHPLGSEEFTALLVFRNLQHRSPTCSDTKERCSCCFFLSFVFNQLFIYRNKWKAAVWRMKETGNSETRRRRDAVPLQQSVAGHPVGQRRWNIQEGGGVGPQLRRARGRAGAAARSLPEGGGAGRCGAVRSRAEPGGAAATAPAPAPAGPGRAAEFRNLPGRGGQAGTWQHGGEEGQGRGGRGAAGWLVGLLAVGIPSGEEDGDFTEGSAGVCPCLKGWRQKSLSQVVFVYLMCCNWYRADLYISRYIILYVQCTPNNLTVVLNAVFKTCTRLRYPLLCRGPSRTSCPLWQQ